MFSFFKRKSAKQVHYDADVTRRNETKNETKISEVLLRQSSANTQTHDRNSSKTKEQSVGPNEPVDRQGSKSANGSGPPQCRDASSLKAAEKCEQSSEVFEVFRNGNCKTNDLDLGRRNSKTSKEIVNLLLPEDSVKYKKDASYLSKTGVQNLLEKIGRGKKHQQQHKSDNKKKNRSWSFGGTKFKSDAAADERRKSIDCENDLKYSSEPSEDDSHREDSINFDSLMCEIDNINSKFQEVTECGEMIKSLHAIGDVTNDDVEFELKCRNGARSPLIDNDLRGSLTGVVPPAGISERDDEVDDRSRRELTSNLGKNAKLEEESRGGGRYFGTAGDQSEPKRDTVLTETLPLKIIEFNARLSSNSSSSDEESASDSESASEYISTESSASPIDSSTKQVTDGRLYVANGVANDAQNLLIDPVESDCLDPLEMGTTESKDNKPPKTVISEFRNSIVIDEPQVVDKNDYVVVVDNNLLSSVNDANDEKHENTNEADSDTSFVKGSLSLEITNVSVKEVKECDSLSSDSVNCIVETMDKEVECTKEAQTKKHVTFHNVIEFDDGEKYEDMCEEDSYASIDDLEEDKIMEVDNVENPDDDFQQMGIVELEESSVSDDESAANKNTSNKIEIKELDVENDENMGFDDQLTMDFIEEIERKKNELMRIVKEKFVSIRIKDEEPKAEINKLNETVIDETKMVESDEETEEEIEEEELVEDEEEEDDEIIETSESVADVEFNNKIVPDSVSNDSFSNKVDCEKCCKNDDVIVEQTTVKQSAIIDTWLNCNYGEKEEETAYSELLKLLDKQMRGLVGQDERLADLQERAAALHRVQNEVCSARKEAELVRQKLWHVEADLSATRTRNSQLLEDLETKTENTKALEMKIKELTEKAAHLQELLDKLIPENEQLKEMYDALKLERDEERKIIEETLAQTEEERVVREEWWKAEFEKLRSQGAEREELLLADCEWKLREVQQSAREKTVVTEQRLKDLQKEADEKCARADAQLAEVGELRTLQAELAALRQASREQARALRLANERASHAAQAEAEAGRLRVLLDREKTALCSVKSQHTKELEEKENRLIERLREQANRLEKEWSEKQLIEEQERKAKECQAHEAMIKDAYDRLEILKATLTKKEIQFQESLERTKTRSDWEMLEIHRQMEKNETKHFEALEKLEETHAEETERINNEMEKKIKDLETSLSTQAVSARATLELVRGQLKAEHADFIQRLKEKHKTDMEKQWEIFMSDKEECLERMKAECILEGQEDKEKREKDLLKDIEELKSALQRQENELKELRSEARSATDTKITAEKKLSEMQVVCEQREMAVRAELTRQAEVAQREARETIDHLNKKCTCLSNLFEDMRSRWQQAPGEAAQLRKALQDEKAKSAALRRQLDALSRFHQDEQEKLRRDKDAKEEQQLQNKKDIEKINDNLCDRVEEETDFVEVRSARRKRKKKKSPSPIKDVYLPPVTVPMRIKQFDQIKRKK